MINLQFIMGPDEPSIMEYDVHPASQQTAIPIPDGACGVVVWLGTIVTSSTNEPEASDEP